MFELGKSRKKYLLGGALFLILIGLISGAYLYNRDEPLPFEENHFVIGVYQPNLTEPWRVDMYKEIKDRASLYDNLRVVFRDGHGDTDKQIGDLVELMDYDIDLLIVSMNDSSVMTPIIGDIYKEIPVIVLDRDVEGYDYTLFIGLDNYSIGHQIGELVKSEDHISHIVEILGDTSSKPTIERSKGFLDAISDVSHIDVLERIEANWEKDKAEDMFSDAISNSDQIDLIYAHSDDMALGAYKAMLKNDMKSEDVIIIGIDGLPGEGRGLELVENGILDGTFICPTGGKEAIEYAIDILSGESGIPKKVILRSQYVNTSNIGDFIDPYVSYEAKDEIIAPEDIVFGFAQVGSESSWRLANSESIQEAAKAAGINLMFRNVDSSFSDEEKQERQIQHIRDFIEAGVDVIGFSPIVESGWDQVLSEAKEAGIPVILSDRYIDAGPDFYTTYMGSDFIEEGRRGARWLLSAEIAKEPGSTNQDQIRIVEIQGTLNAAPTIGRKKGFQEILFQNPGYSIIDTGTGHFTLEGGRQVMESYLNLYGKTIDVVYAHNDDMALGAIEAIEAYGLEAGSDILIISVDGTKEALKMINIGKLNCSVECSPLLGQGLMKVVIDVSNGVELPIEIITEEGVFTKENAASAIGGRKY